MFVVQVKKKGDFKSVGKIHLLERHAMTKARNLSKINKAGCVRVHNLVKDELMYKAVVWYEGERIESEAVDSMTELNKITMGINESVYYEYFKAIYVLESGKWKRLTTSFPWTYL